MGECESESDTILYEKGNIKKLFIRLKSLSILVIYLWNWW